MKRCSLIIAIAFLSGCATGVRYKSPSEGEPSAEFIKNKGALIGTFTDSGCLATYSSLINGMKIYADKPAHIGYYEKVGSNHYCSLSFSFIPEKGAVYELTTELVRSQAEIDSFFKAPFSGAKCFVAILKISPDGSRSLVDINKEDPNNFRKKCEPN